MNNVVDNVIEVEHIVKVYHDGDCLLYTSPSPRD